METPPSVEGCRAHKGEIQGRAHGLDKSSMPFEWKKYGLAMNRLKKIAGKHDKYEVGKKSRLWWSKIFAEDGLGQSLGFVSAPDSLEQPSSVLPSIPCLQICPCDIC